MRNRIGTLAVAALLALVAAAGLWAAGPQEQATPSQAPIPPGPLGVYQPAISMTSVMPVDQLMKFNPGEDITNNVWTKIYENELGIRLSYLWTVERSQYNEKLNLTLASRTLPDVFMCSPQQFVMLHENNAIADLTKAWDTYASSFTKDMYATDPTGVKSAMVNGRLMSIPGTGFPQDGASVLWLRTDWLQKLGLSEPKTQADVMKIAEAFTTKDPDGNGKADTFGLALHKDLWGTFASLTAFFNAYHAYPGIWVKNSAGRLVFGTIQPEMKAALRDLQKMYATGQIDKEYSVKDPVKVSEDVAAGRIGIEYGAWWNPFWPLNFSRDKDPNAEWVACAPLSADAQPGLAQYSRNVGSYVVVNRKYSNPEAAVKMLNLWIDAIQNNPSIEKAGKYLVNLQDMSVVYYKYLFIGGDFAWPPLGNVDRTIQIGNAMKTGDTSKMGLEAALTLQDMMKLTKGDRSGGTWGNWGAYGPRGSMWAMQKIGQDAGLIDRFFGIPTPAMAEKGPALEKLRDEVFTGIITGAPVDATFDKFVQDWKKLGGDDITKEVNAWYAKQK